MRILPVVTMTPVFTRFAHFPLRMEHRGPENRERSMDRKGKFCTKIQESKQNLYYVMVNLLLCSLLALIYVWIEKGNSAQKPLFPLLFQLRGDCIQIQSVVSPVQAYGQGQHQRRHRRDVRLCAAACDFNRAVLCVSDGTFSCPLGK